MTSLTITTIQADLHWEDKEANFRMFEDKFRNLDQPTEIIVLPEMFSTGFSMQPQRLAERMDGDTIAWMKEMSAKHRAIITGSIIIEEEGKYFNRLIWMQPNGVMGYYDKRHRFGFAGEDQHYTAGTKRLIASVKGWKINLQVCYDLRFPVWARQQTANAGGSSEMIRTEIPEYDLLIYVANWPDRRSHAWKTLLCARAIENQSCVIGLNRVGKDGNDIYHSGNSMVIDPLGEVLYHMADEEDVFTITLQKDHLEAIRAKFPFWKDADHFDIAH